MKQPSLKRSEYCLNLLRPTFIVRGISAEWIWFPIKNITRSYFATIFCNLKKGNQNKLHLFTHMGPLMRERSLRFAVFEWIAVGTLPTPWICSNSWKPEILCKSQPAVQKFLHPFKNVRQTFICSTASIQTFSSAVYLLDWIHPKVFVICSAIPFQTA